MSVSSEMTNGALLKRLTLITKSLDKRLEGLAGQGSQLEEKYELIDTITVNEVCTGVSRIVEPDTTPYNFKGLILECFFGPITPGNLTCDFFGIGTDQMECTIGSVLLPNFGHAENPSFFQLYCELVHGIWRTWAVPPVYSYSTPVQANEYYAEEFIPESHIPVCSGFTLGTASGIAIPIDSIIRVYGIRRRVYTGVQNTPIIN